MLKNNTDLAKIITFDGLDGSGKSIQSQRLMTKLATMGFHSNVFRDLADTRLGLECAKLIECETGDKYEIDFFLMIAARICNARDNIKPYCGTGGVAILDRSFFTSYVYDKVGQNFSHELWNEIWNVIYGEIQPCLSIILDVSVDTAMFRIKNRHRKLDKYENRGHDFYDDVRGRFLTLPSKFEYVKVVDGELSEDLVEDQVLNLVSKVL